jgi:heterodisulfide reductase subunit B
MDFLVMESRARGLPARVPEVALFNKVFLRNVDILGRAYELGLIAEYNLRTRQPLKDLPMGLGMLRRRTVKLLPAVVRRRRRARRLATAPVAARPAAQIGYYPGCSLHSMAAEYDHSIRAVAGALGLEFVEIPGWRCCGSSPAHRVDARRAVEMSLANLTLASDQGLGEITAPCAMCFNRLRSAQHEVAVDPAMRSAMQARLGDDLAAGVRVRSLLDVFLERIGLDGLAARVQRPLAGLTVACYYGCLLTRPPEVTGASDTEYPMGMDRLLRALGATVVDWSDKTSCCGASLSLTRTEIALDLSARILAAARAAGADAVAVACPLCHVNLDARQHQMDPAARGAGEVPVLYVTQLMALAFGLGPEAAALARNMVDPRPLLAQKGLLT